MRRQIEKIEKLNWNELITSTKIVTICDVCGCIMEEGDAIYTVRIEINDGYCAKYDFCPNCSKALKDFLRMLSVRGICYTFKELKYSDKKTVVEIKGELKQK